MTPPWRTTVNKHVLDSLPGSIVGIALNAHNVGENLQLSSSSVENVYNKIGISKLISNSMDNQSMNR